VAAESCRPRERADPAAVEVWREVDRTVIGLFGEHDLGMETELSDAFARCCRPGCAGDVVVDLSQASLIDSSTIAALFGGRELLHGQGRNLILRAPSSQAERVLDLCCLPGDFDPAVPREGPSTLGGHPTDSSR